MAEQQEHLTHQPQLRAALVVAVVAAAVAVQRNRPTAALVALVHSLRAAVVAVGQRAQAS